MQIYIDNSYTCVYTGEVFETLFQNRGAVFVQTEHQKPSQQVFLFLCWILYFTSYITRLNYGAAIVGITADTGITKIAAGLVSTGSFITYCAGQFICGMISDRVSPRKMIFLGLFVSALTNIAMPLWADATAMLAFWCVNGFAQAMIWPAMIRIMAEFFDGNFFKKACVSITVASSAGTVAVYLLVPVCIAIGGWRSVFYLSSVCGVLVALIWLFAARSAEAVCTTKPSFASAKEGKATSMGLRGLFTAAPLFSTALAVILHGILKDGVVTWAPTYLSETYGISASASVLTTVVLPLFSIASVYLAARIDRRWFHNELKTAGVMFAVAGAAALMLFLCTGKSAVAAILGMALLVACMYGVNIMLISYVPKYFDKYGKISSVSGFLNACTYLGSAASSYGFAAIAETSGWSATILIWLFITLAACLLCALGVRKWTKFISKS